MGGWGTVKAAHMPHQWHLLLEGGISKCLYKLAGILFLLSNAGVGDLQSKVTGLLLFPTETEITGFVPGEYGKAQQQALWEALVLERLKLFY